MDESHTQRDDPPRVAAIDVGTNTIRLIVAEALPDGSYRLLDDEKERSRLGQDMSADRTLSCDAIDHAAGAIARMKGIADGYGVQTIRAVATCAVREAPNQQELIDLVRHEAGLELDVISGEEEGRLAFTSVAYAVDVVSRSVAVVDIGGGSTEVVISNGGVIQAIVSMPLGAVRLTEQYALSRLPDESVWRPFWKDVREAVRQHVPRSQSHLSFVVGTGGTFTSLASIAMQRESTGMPVDLFPSSVRGYELSRPQIKRIMEWLRHMDLAGRQRVAGLSEDRAGIIVAGIAILLAVMKRLGVSALQVHDRGIRDGLLLTMVRGLKPGEHDHPHRPPSRMDSVERFAARCNYDHGHCRHVSMLALRIFDQMAAQLDGAAAWLTAENRELLEAASILHDVGYHINYQRHHKHSYHLIVHSDMPGFTQREREIVANVSRYHRRAHPKMRHGSFARLGERDREVVRHLSAILRVADGLDRTHTASVSDVHVTIDGSTARFLVESKTDPTVNLWGAARKTELFHKVFNLEARFDAHGQFAHMSTVTAAE
jgi:exopolyphosphatase/guanosine-5'-triphosphate,3'-diphosphate pyrophosphatase